MSKQSPNVGTVFLIPLDEYRFAGGIVTHKGQYGRKAVYIVAISLDQTFNRDESPSYVATCVSQGRRWRDRVARHGFERGDWIMIGSVDVPRPIEPLPPVFTRFPNEGYLVSNTDLMTFVEEVRIQRRIDFISDGISGDQYVRNMLHKHFVEKSLDVSAIYPSQIN